MKSKFVVLSNRSFVYLTVAMPVFIYAGALASLITFVSLWAIHAWVVRGIKRKLISQSINDGLDIPAYELDMTYAELVQLYESDGFPKIPPDSHERFVVFFTKGFLDPISPAFCLEDGEMIPETNIKDGIYYWDDCINTDDDDDET